MKLTYFDLKGRAELSRYILAYSGQDYEDVQIPFHLSKEAHPFYKDTSPFGKLPYVTLDNGKNYPQTISIARFFAENAGLVGQTPEERLHAHFIVDFLRIDIAPMFRNIGLLKDEPEKVAQLKETAFNKIESCFKKLNDCYVYGEDTFLKSGLSWADIAFFNIVFDLFPKFEVPEEYVSNNPKLVAIMERVKSEPKIAERIEKRPNTLF